MKTTAFCCLALATAACGFEGFDAAGEPVSGGPPVDPLPVGTGVIRGVIESPELEGELGVALLPNNFELPATSPCVPSNLRRGAQRGAFSISGVAPGDYMLVAYRFGNGYTTFERTLRKVTVTGESTDAGTFRLPAPLRASVSDGDGSGGPGGPGGIADEDDKVKWTAPNGFTTLAFDVTNATFVCSAGVPLAVRGNYEVLTSGVHDVKIVVESANKELMSIQVLPVDD